MKIKRGFTNCLAVLAALLPAPLAFATDSCPFEGCRVQGGVYRILLPPRDAGAPPVGAIMYFHGYQGSAAETLADSDLAAVAHRLGVALIAPDGAGGSWSFPGSPAQARDEFAYVGQVLDDVARRFPVDPKRIMASGFSQGGSMVWHLACRMPTRFAAFAPIAGAFWEPLPVDCAKPRPALVHFHGLADTTVPIAGRALRGGFRQGDLFKSLDRLAPGCALPARTDFQDVNSDLLTCRRASCPDPASARLDICLHGGGHFVDPAWVERAWNATMPGTSTVRLTFP